MRRAMKVFTRRLPVKKSHVRKFSAEASREKISREIFFWEGLP